MNHQRTAVPPLNLLKNIMLGCTAALILLHMGIALLMSGSKMNYSFQDQLILYTESGLLLVLLLCLAAYLVLAGRDPETSRQVKQALRRLRCPEMAVLLFILLYFAVICLLNAIIYPGSFSHCYGFLVDAAISICLLFPIGMMIGMEKSRRLMHTLQHVLMFGGTAFVLYALWHLFSGTEVILPGGQYMGMKSNYVFWMGANPNNSAAICTAMAMISLYMMVNGRRTEKILYGFAFACHILLVLYTNSRGNFLALWIVITLAVFWALWKKTGTFSRIKQLLISMGGALAAAILFYLLRKGVFEFYKAVVQVFPQQKETTRDDLSIDPGRFQIWYATLSHMVSSPRAFFLGTPIHLIPSTYLDTFIRLYGMPGYLSQAHNIIMHFGMVMGMPGMAAFLAFLVLMLRRCVRVLFGKSGQTMPGAYILPLCVGGMLIVNMGEALLMFFLTLMGSLFFLYTGWITALDREKNL